MKDIWLCHVFVICQVGTNSDFVWPASIQARILGTVRGGGQEALCPPPSEKEKSMWFFAIKSWKGLKKQKYWFFTIKSWNGWVEYLGFLGAGRTLHLTTAVHCLERYGLDSHLLPMPKHGVLTSIPHYSGSFSIKIIAWLQDCLKLSEIQKVFSFWKARIQI